MDGQRNAASSPRFIPTDRAAVLHLEFPADIAAQWLAAHPDATGLSYGYVLFTVRRPV